MERARPAREKVEHMSRRTEAAVLAADRPVHPGAARDGGARGAAARPPAAPPTWRAAPPPGPSPCSSSSTAHGSPTREALDGLQALAAPPHRSGLYVRRLPAARPGRQGPRPGPPDPAALQRPALPLPGPLDHPVLDRLHLDRPRQRARRDLRRLLLLPRRHRPHPAARRRAPRRRRGGGFSADSLLKIVLQLLVPFLAGQVLRRWIGGFMARHKKVLGLVDRGSILLVVYAAFSEGMVAGIWHQVSPPGCWACWPSRPCCSP